MFVVGLAGLAIAVSLGSDEPPPYTFSLDQSVVCPRDVNDAWYTRSGTAAGTDAPVVEAREGCRGQVAQQCGLRTDERGSVMPARKGTTRIAKARRRACRACPGDLATKWACQSVTLVILAR